MLNTQNKEHAWKKRHDFDGQHHPAAVFVFVFGIFFPDCQTWSEQSLIILTIFADYLLVSVTWVSAVSRRNNDNNVGKNSTKLQV